MTDSPEFVRSIWPDPGDQLSGSAVRLPDGSEFTSWEKPFSFSRTLVVDQHHQSASDDNPGTENKPLLTINAAAQRAQLGDRVLIKSGVYRECVRPARGGTDPDTLISYEAAEDADVVIDGAEIIEGGWKTSEGWSGRKRSAAGIEAWMIRLPRSWFVGTNPFSIPNKTIAVSAGGFDIQKVERVEIYMLRRGLLFQDGRLMRQVSNYSELSESPGSFFVDPSGLILHVRAFDDMGTIPHTSGSDDPNDHHFEATAREQWFCPDDTGIAYIRIKGIKFTHAGNGFPFTPQDGALSTNRGHHWIIEDCHFSWANGIGMELGRRDARMGWPEIYGHHIIRRNTVTDCGVCGMASLGLLNSLVEDNLVERCCWHNVERQYESAAIKLHHVHHSLIRRNLVRNTIYGCGVWLDYDNINSRFTQNVIVDSASRAGGLFVEASHEANMVDHNIVWGVRCNDGRGGHGLYCHNTDRLRAVHNLIVGCESYGMCLPQGQYDRFISGRGSTSRKHVIHSNILMDSARWIQLANTDSVCDENCYAGNSQPGPFLIDSLQEHLDLRTWREFHGFDLKGVEASIKAELDLDSLAMSLSFEGDLPECKPFSEFEIDPAAARADRTCPGPFAALPEHPVNIDPRHKDE